MGTIVSISARFTKGKNLYGFLLFPCQQNFSKRGLYLTLLHSEQPKLYGVLAILSAIGLKERICSQRRIFFFKEGGNTENGRVASPESILFI